MLAIEMKLLESVFKGDFFKEFVYQAGLSVRT